jgi:putative ABC transport system permease protein
VILRGGSQAELNSVLTADQFRVIETAPGIAVDSDGNALISAELYVVVDGIKKDLGTEANLPMRGVGLQAPRLRGQFELTAGRMFETGTNEIVAGEAVLDAFEGFELGQTIRLGSNEWQVVGLFSTGGTVFESELWADIGVVQNLYQRGSSLQSIRARLTSPEAITGLEEFAANDPRINELDIFNEKDFYAGQSGTLTQVITFIGWPLAIIMAIGAFAGAWNAMYSSVDARMREIATLRAIGFSGGAAAMGTLIESLVLSAIGGLIGAVGTYLLFNGASAATLGAGFTQVVFSFAVTGDSVIAGMILAVIIGFLGGLVPAIRSATVPLLTVHRSD